MQINLSIIYPKKRIEVEHDTDEMIDEYDVPIKIMFCIGARVALSLKDAEELCDKLSFCIQDYRRIINEGK